MEGKTPKGTYAGTLDDNDDPLPRELTRSRGPEGKAALSETKRATKKEGACWD